MRAWLLVTSSKKGRGRSPSNQAVRSQHRRGLQERGAPWLHALCPGVFCLFFLNRRYKSRLCSWSSCWRWSPAKQEIQTTSQSSWNKALYLEPCMTEKLKSVCSKRWGSLDGGGSVMAKICLSSDRLAVSKEVISLILTLWAQKWKWFLSKTLSSRKNLSWRSLFSGVQQRQYISLQGKAKSECVLDGFCWVLDDLLFF